MFGWEKGAVWFAALTNATDSVHGMLACWVQGLGRLRECHAWAPTSTCTTGRPCSMPFYPAKQVHFPYAAAVLKESMRLYAPSITLMREAPASGAWQLGGYDVPPGTALQVGPWQPACNPGA